ncbi:MAG TPA: hypothetical protein VJT08_22025 [Terriglobales bacterium]|nr:hypothetical protein [Acidobacteriaceae bacterium]HKR33174.1 hypothetical protein [Terriglobales bacterium]
MEEREIRDPTGVSSDVDHLLAVVCHLAQHDPPPVIRERLALLSAQRLGGSRILSRRNLVHRRWLPRMAPAVVCALTAVIACVLVAGVIVHRRNHMDRVNRAIAASPARPEPVSSMKSTPAATPAAATSLGHRRFRSTKTPATQLSRIVIALPYSDSAVATGTEVTVPVLLSQDELMSMGVPMSPALHDRKFLADLLLGDDGLPRAISVPLPPGSLAEKR